MVMTCVLSMEILGKTLKTERLLIVVEVVQDGKQVRWNIMVVLFSHILPNKKK